MTTYVPAPTGQDVADFLGRGDDTTLVALAGEHVGIVTAMARAYTRDKGFDTTSGQPADDVAAAITTATARLTANPESVREEHIADYSATRTVWAGWNLAELFILNRYRKRAQ